MFARFRDSVSDQPIPKTAVPVAPVLVTAAPAPPLSPPAWTFLELFAGPASVLSKLCSASGGPPLHDSLNLSTYVTQLN